MSADDDELALPGAIGAVRVGETVRKPAGPWTPSMQALLRFVRAEGFELAPEPLGVDDEGREVLAWIEGNPAWRPWPSVLLGSDGVIELGRTLRVYHDIVRAFDPGEDAVWRSGPARLGPDEIVLHGDFAPWNTVWRGSSLVGVIDWDMAEPGLPIVDLAFLALHVVPLRSDARAALAGFASPPDRRARLATLCDTYGGFSVAQVIEAVASFHERDRRRTVGWGREGREPWATFLARGELATIEDDAGWLDAHREELSGS